MGAVAHESEVWARDRKMAGQQNAGPSGLAVDQACQQALALSDAGATQRESLGLLVHAAEVAAGGDVVASILVLDGDGLLRNGASPNLPDDYLRAIDRLKPDPGVGTCAAAAATGAIVLTPDFQADEKWAELRHLPLALGFVGAWSMPIKTRDGRVLGTFGTYYRERRQPDADERARIAQLAAAAATVLSRPRDAASSPA
jgi:GAF domain-containing protein